MYTWIYQIYHNIFVRLLYIVNCYVSLLIVVKSLLLLSNETDERWQ